MKDPDRPPWADLCMRGRWRDGDEDFYGGPPCENPRWIHPEKGPLVLCEEHAQEVFDGLAKAPPLRKGFDYQTTYPRALVVDLLPQFSPTETDEKAATERGGEYVNFVFPIIRQKSNR